MMLATLLANAYMHDFDPVILPIWGDFALRWYNLSYILGFVIAWLVILWMAKTNRCNISPANVGLMMTYVIIGILVGGRVGYVLFYEPRYFITFMDAPPYWNLLAINKGGMSSHGGMLGAIIACWLFARRDRVSPLHVFDVGAIACTPGLFLGRVANFLNAELWGRPLPDHRQEAPPWWSIQYPQELRFWSAADLTQLNEIVTEANVSQSEWQHALNTLMVYGEQAPTNIMRLVDGTITRLIEQVREGNQVVIEALRPLLTAHYPSQLLQALTDGPILLAVLAIIWFKPRKPGVVASAFLIVYGLLRISTEFVRQPDEGVALLLGLSRGQVLSVLMILAGAVWMAWCLRRENPPLGGLLHPAVESPNVATSETPGVSQRDT